MDFTHGVQLSKHSDIIGKHCPIVFTLMVRLKYFKYRLKRCHHQAHVTNSTTGKYCSITVIFE